MSENTGDQTTNFVELAGDIVSAYVSNNPVRPADLPDLIRQVHTALQALATGAAAASPEAEIEKPTAAQIRKSVMPEGIISFIDGKPYKTLKRHLKTHGLDPYSYRQRYGLPAEELCGRLGDDGVLKAAYRGGCRSLPEPLSESDTPWRHLPTSSGFVSPRPSTIP